MADIARNDCRLTDWRNRSISKRGGPKNSSIRHEKSGYIGVMPVWDLPEGDEMDTQPGVRSLTRTRYTATACLGMCVRPHKIMIYLSGQNNMLWLCTVWSCDQAWHWAVIVHSIELWLCTAWGCDYAQHWAVTTPSTGSSGRTWHTIKSRAHGVCHMSHMQESCGFVSHPP